MQPLTLYVLAAILFVLGLASIGGATFGRKRNQRLILAAAGIVLWIVTLILYSQAANQTAATAAPTPTVQPPAMPTAEPPTATPEPAIAQAEATATLQPIPDIPGRLAFHSDRTGQLEIWTMNADGSDLRQLTESPERDLEPDWSPDGSTIVFSSGRDDPANVRLYLMDADGSNQRPLMEFTPYDQLGASWSPDGEWILFYSNILEDGLPWFEVYKVRPDGTDLTNVSNAPGTNNTRPDWSPDGSRIVFVSERDGYRQIYVMDADGGNQMRLTETAADDYRPRWSPDGTEILFESNRDGNSNLYVMDAPPLPAIGPMEETVRLLTFPGFNDEAADWAVNGDMIVFSSDRGSAGLTNWDIYIMNADGSNIFRLTQDENLDRFPAWTP